MKLDYAGLAYDRLYYVGVCQVRIIILSYVRLCMLG